MQIPSMPETTINLTAEGCIEIIQKDHSGGEDAVVYFPIDLAPKIANEILRLAKQAEIGKLV